MKKILLAFVALLSMSVSFSSCSDDDDNMTFTNTASADAQGTYTGTYYRYQVDDQGKIVSDTISAEGSFTIGTDSTKYTAYVQFDCKDFDISSKSITNIAHAQKGFSFYNNSVNNTMGTMFTGRVYDDQTASARFNLTKTVKVGRAYINSNFIFYFVGKRN